MLWNINNSKGYPTVHAVLLLCGCVEDRVDVLCVHTMIKMTLYSRRRESTACDDGSPKLELIPLFFSWTVRICIFLSPELVQLEPNKTLKNTWTKKKCLWRGYKLLLLIKRQLHEQSTNWVGRVISRVGNLLFALSLMSWLVKTSVILSRRYLQNERQERFPHVALYKRRTWANRSCHSFETSDESDLLPSLF